MMALRDVRRTEETVLPVTRLRVVSWITNRCQLVFTGSETVAFEHARPQRSNSRGAWADCVKYKTATRGPRRTD